MRFDRAHRLLAFASTLWAFIMIASTDALHPVAIGVFAAGFLAAMLRRKLSLPPLVVFWRLLNLGALAATYYGWFVAKERIDTVAYLFLYLVVNRAYALEKHRDHLQLYTLSFFMVLATAVSTASLGFAPMVAVYTAMMLATLVAYTMSRDCDMALGRDGRVLPVLGRRETNPDAPHRLPESDNANRARLDSMPYLTPKVLAALAFATLFVVFIAGSLFFFIPRIETGSLFRGFEGGIATRQVSGFSDTVSLGGVGAIQTDPAISMRVTPEDSQGQPAGRRGEFIRLRGATLESWDGRVWQKAAQISADASPLRDTKEVFLGDDSRAEPGLKYRIILEPVGTQYLFLPDPPIKVEFDRRMRAKSDSFSKTVSLDRSPNQVISYVVLPERRVGAQREPGEAEAATVLPSSYVNAAKRLVEDRLPRLLAGSSVAAPERTESGVQLSPDRRDVLLKLPSATEDTDTIRRVAQDWTGALGEPSAIAREIEGRLRRDFAYNLDTSSFSKRDNHLTRFLETEKRGHCEYFATAMTLMLRARGIPSRVVNGYVSDEWSDSGGGYYVVRQQNAHSWVEAYIRGRGWMTFDPTPADGVGSARNPETFGRQLSRWMDGVRLAWYRYVVDYSVKDQQDLLGNIFKDQRFRSGVRWLFRLDDKVEDLSLDDLKASKHLIPILVLVGIVVLALLVLAAKALLLRFAARFRNGKSSSRASLRAPIRPYLDLLAACERESARPPAQTALAYARDFAASRPELADFPALTEAYYRARFDTAAWSEEDSRRAKALVHALVERRTKERAAA